MRIRIKQWEGCFHLPEYKTAGAAGADCYATEECLILCGEAKRIPLGFAIEMPSYCAALIMSRSSSFMQSLNCSGLIDSDYRGQVFASVQYFGIGAFRILRGDRICQMVITHVYASWMQVVDKLRETARSEGGFGSTNAAV